MLKWIFCKDIFLWLILRVSIVVKFTVKIIVIKEDSVILLQGNEFYIELANANKDFREVIVVSKAKFRV